MSSPTLALFVRSLRIEARERNTYLIRSGLVVVILWFLWLQVQYINRGLGGAPGLRFFGTLIFIDLVFLTLFGLTHFGSAIAEEKEEGTLPLLRMTRLSPVAILLGKSTSRMVGMLLLLLLQLPFALLAMTLGGVARVQVAAAYATLMAFLILLANLALLFSTICRDTRHAAGMTGVALIGWGWAPGLLRAVVTDLLEAPTQLAWLLTFADRLEACTPWSRLTEIVSTGFAGPVVGLQVQASLVAAVVLFTLSWVGFDVFTRRQPSARAGLGLLARLRRTPTAASGGRLGRVWAGSAIQWKEHHVLCGGGSRITARFVGYGLLFMVLGAMTRWRGVGGMLVSMSIMFAIAELAFIASNVFAREVREQTLPVLLLLPVSVAQLAYAKLAGCLPTLIPIASYFMLGVILEPNMWEVFQHTEALVGVYWGISMTVLFLHLTAYLSLKVRRGAVALALLIMFFGTSCISSIFMMAAFSGSSSDGELMMGFWAVVMNVLTVPLHTGVGRLLRELGGR